MIELLTSFEGDGARCGGSCRRAARDSNRHVDRDVVLEWVRATGVQQVLLEDAETRQFGVMSF